MQEILYVYLVVDPLKIESQKPMPFEEVCDRESTLHTQPSFSNLDLIALMRYQASRSLLTL